jgi:hypothetical protein
MNWFRKRKSERAQPETVQVTISDPFSGIRVEAWTIGKEVDRESYNRLKDADGRLWGITTHREDGQIDGAIILKEEFDKLEAGIVAPEITRRIYTENKAKAENGDSMAQMKLGICYLEGTGVDIDESEATRLFNQSAQQGNGEAQDYLGTCYALGKGTDQNFVVAYAWLSMAIENGRLQAAKAREMLVSQMSPSEIREGRETFCRWLVDKPNLLSR